MGANYNVYVAFGTTDNATIHKVDHEGNKVWEYTDISYTIYDICIDNDGYVYVASAEEAHKLTFSGETVWKYPISDGGRSSIAVSDNNDVYINDGKELHKLDMSEAPSDGSSFSETEWVYTDIDSGIQDIAVDSTGNAYIAYYNGESQKIDASGNRIWEFTKITAVTRSIAVGEDDSVYVGQSNHSPSNHIYKIDISKAPTDGSDFDDIVWEYEIPSGNGRNLAVDSNNNVFVATDSGDRITKLDSNGNDLWSYTHTNNVRDVAVDGDGYSYTASWDNTSDKVDQNGNEEWSYNAGSSVQVVAAASNIKEIETETLISGHSKGEGFAQGNIAVVTDIEVPDETSKFNFARFNKSGFSIQKIDVTLHPQIASGIGTAFGNITEVVLISGHGTGEGFAQGNVKEIEVPDETSKFNFARFNKSGFSIQKIDVTEDVTLHPQIASGTGTAFGNITITLNIIKGYGSGEGTALGNITETEVEITLISGHGSGVGTAEGNAELITILHWLTPEKASGIGSASAQLRQTHFLSSTGSGVGSATADVTIVQLLGGSGSGIGSAEGDLDIIIVVHWVSPEKASGIGSGQGMIFEHEVVVEERLYILDSDLNIIRELEDYEYFSWHYKLRKHDNFRLKLSRYHPDANRLHTGRILLYQKGDKYRGGEILRRKISVDSSGGKEDENWIIDGVSYGEYLKTRLAIRDVRVGSGYDDKTDNAESLMKYYIDRNVINPAVADRKIENLELEADQNRGDSFRFRARFQRISDIITELCLNSGLGFETVFDKENNNFLFQIVEGQDEGESDIIFSPNLGNIQEIEYEESWLDFESVQFVAGQGQGSDRKVGIVTRDDYEEVGE